MPLHPQGDFAAEIVDHGLTKAQTGTYQLQIRFRTDKGHVTGFFPFTDKAIDYTLEKINSMGFKGDSLEDLNDGECLVGNKCNITVHHSEYNGTTSARVVFVNPEGQSGMAIKRDDDAGKNIKRFDALLRKQRKNNPPIENMLDEENIPF